MGGVGGQNALPRVSSGIIGGHDGCLSREIGAYLFEDLYSHYPLVQIQIS